MSFSQPVEYGDLKLTILEAESICKIATPLVLKCRITNTCNRNMELNLNFNTGQNRGQGFTGSSEQALGALEPEKSKDFILTIFPTRLGIVNVSGLVITDLYMIRNYEFGNFLQVFSANELNETYEKQNFVRYHDIPVNVETVSPLVV